MKLFLSLSEIEFFVLLVFMLDNVTGTSFHVHDFNDDEFLAMKIVSEAPKLSTPLLYAVFPHCWLKFNVYICDSFVVTYHFLYSVGSSLESHFKLRFIGHNPSQFKIRWNWYPETKNLFKNYKFSQVWDLFMKFQHRRFRVRQLWSMS